jgi:hypothetical protein
MSFFFGSNIVNEKAIGYMRLNKDFKCGSKQFEVGQTYKSDDKFRFFRNPLKVIGNKVDDAVRYAEIIVPSYTKEFPYLNPTRYCEVCSFATEIKIVREVSYDFLLKFSGKVTTHDRKVSLNHSIARELLRKTAPQGVDVTFYLKDGLLHNEKGSAICDQDKGFPIMHVLNGKLNDTPDSPAFNWNNGKWIQFYTNDTLHKTNGPASIYKRKAWWFFDNDIVNYYINGIPYDEINEKYKFRYLYVAQIGDKICIKGMIKEDCPNVSTYDELFD